MKRFTHCPLCLCLIFLPALVQAQDCDCCMIRTVGQGKYDRGDYSGAVSSWKNAKTVPDAMTKCADLDALITKAQKRIDDARRKREQEAATQREREREAILDDQVWDIAQGAFTGCQRYLQKYPTGRHAAEARQCIKDYSDDDDDGVPNKGDRCPDKKGNAADNGCPPAQPLAPAFRETPIPSPVRHGQKSGLTMIPVEGGTFNMGSPGNEVDRYADECQHDVSVKNFAIGRYEVTQADWREVLGSDPPNLYFKSCDECPVENVSWDDIQEFLQKANQLYGRRFRLPAETEWEYAARGGKKNRGYLYAGSSTIDNIAWYRSNSSNKTHSVGEKDANELGLYDMSGNVWEWCRDPYRPYPGCSEPKETEGDRRVLRGGSWYSGYSYCRSAIRVRYIIYVKSYLCGFRLAED